MVQPPEAENGDTRGMAPGEAGGRPGGAGTPSKRAATKWSRYRARALGQAPRSLDHDMNGHSHHDLARDTGCNPTPCAQKG